MPNCDQCDTRIRTGSLCQQCALERNHAGVEPDADTPEDCAVCGDHAPDGDYAEDARGVWLCGPCARLGLTPREHAQLVAETPDALGGAVRWAVGDDDAYPDADPGTLEQGFATASDLRAVADGGPDLQAWALDHVHEQVADEAEEPQDNSLWTSKGRLKAEASKVDFVERDEVADIVDALEARGDVVYWHGQIAPTDADHIGEIVASEAEADYPRRILIGRLNTAKQSAEKELVADGGQQVSERRLPPYAEPTDDGVRCTVCGSEAASLQALTHDCIYANDLVADGGERPEPKTKTLPNGDKVNEAGDCRFVASSAGTVHERGEWPGDEHDYDYYPKCGQRLPPSSMWKSVDADTPEEAVVHYDLQPCSNCFDDAYELEQKRHEEHDLVADGGQRFEELPAPDRFFQAIGDAEIEMERMDHDEVTFRSQHVPGGRFGFELSASYSYASYDCRQIITLDRDGAEALRDRLDDVLESDRRGAGGGN